MLRHPWWHFRLRAPLIRTNSDQTAYLSSCYFCGVKSQATDFTPFFEKKHNSRLCMIFLYFCIMFSTENGRSLVFVQSLFVCQRNLANFNQQQKSNYSDHVCNRRGLFFVFCLGFARTSLTTKTAAPFFCQQRDNGAFKRFRIINFVQQLKTKR